jgi:hypothetical protein
MIDPVLRSIFGEGEFCQAVLGDGFGEVQQNAQTGLRRESVSMGHRDMETAGYIVLRFSKAGRGQEFFHRKVRELNNLGTIGIDNDK